MANQGDGFAAGRALDAYSGGVCRGGAAVIWGIRRDQILDNWFSKAERMVARILDRMDTGYEVGDVLLQLQLGRMQLWVVDDWEAVAVTEISVWPQYKALTVVFLSGEGMKQWFPELMDTLEAYAGEQGCRYVEAHGRRGWEKVGRTLGYRHAYSIMRKEVDGRQEWSERDGDDGAMGGAATVPAAGMGDSA